MLYKCSALKKEKHPYQEDIRMEEDVGNKVVYVVPDQ